MLTERFSECQSPRPAGAPRSPSRVLAGIVLVRLYGTLVPNDRSDPRTARAQPALSLRLGPQVQTLLSREGRHAGGCRPGQGRSGRNRSLVRCGRARARTSAKASDSPALEGDHLPRLRPAHTVAAQGRRQLSGSRVGTVLRLEIGPGRDNHPRDMGPAPLRMPRSVTRATACAPVCPSWSGGTAGSSPRPAFRVRPTRGPTDRTPRGPRTCGGCW